MSLHRRSHSFMCGRLAGPLGQRVSYQMYFSTFLSSECFRCSGRRQIRPGRPERRDICLISGDLRRKIPIFLDSQPCRSLIHSQNPGLHQGMKQKSKNIPAIDQDFRVLSKGGSLSLGSERVSAQYGVVHADRSSLAAGVL